MAANAYFRGRYLLIYILAISVSTFILVNNRYLISPHLSPRHHSCQQCNGEWKNKALSYVKDHLLPHSWRTVPLWPNEDDGDRILEQMSFVPPDLQNITQNGTKLKVILLHVRWDLHVNGTHEGQQSFLEDNCPVNTCRITKNISELEKADAVIFSGAYDVNITRPNEAQVWVFHLLESPLYYPRGSIPKVFNWTATYRSDSDVPSVYGKFYLYDPTVIYKPQAINYAANKTKKVAWFVSNCHAFNKRLEYSLELSKFIDVDIFGKCGSRVLHCGPLYRYKDCFSMLKNEYKFYLAFENANCKYYITEKFFTNALSNDVLPIVMGARKEDYERAAPYNSYIHVEDFESPKHLAEYLHKLDKNDSLYNEYFQWKGTGELSQRLNAHFWCRFCAMLHSNIPQKTYDLETWWRGNGICTPETWRNKPLF